VNLENCFVLLDDCHASDANPSSRLYTGFVKQHVCTDARMLDNVWSAVESDMSSGLHAAVLIDYEWGAKLQSAGIQKLSPDEASALRVLVFSKLERWSGDQVSQWLMQQDGHETPTPAGIADLQSSVDAPAFEAGVAQIQDLIRAGETYQVNFTYRVSGSQYGSPIGLFRRLRQTQPVSMGALIALPHAHDADAQRWVLSSSPELFVRNRGGHMTTRPMKGTAPRAAGADADSVRARWLAGDAKNRAENVMIVDLLRNDLGRISTIGSVRVPQLFSVETYPTVHQMTSTVESSARPDVDFPGLLRALFPCGSITGTPKVHTMDRIAELETTPRGLYCGAIGWVEPAAPPARLGDLCLSVAIRTITLEAASDGRREALLGLGGGIVIDSNPSSEFEETRVKARFLTSLDPGFTLFETMLLRNGRLRHGRLHVERLRASAMALGFSMDVPSVAAQVNEYVAALGNTADQRIRMDLGHDGTLRLMHSPITKVGNKPVNLLLAQAPVPATERGLLGYKTSLRGTYDRAIQMALERGAFDTVFFNLCGEITEGARSNLMVRLDGIWCTPPLECGVLPGIMRQRLLSMRKEVCERVISIQELTAAEEIAVCSSLRGILRGRLVLPNTQPARR
jgi:para-aminobenzoate synthetase/4-amino-4-deoxychorismate lyase